MADRTPQTVFLEYGGRTHEHDWPLTEVLAYQMAKGLVRQASQPGPASWYRPPEADDEADATPGPPAPLTRELPPHRNATKADWVGFAVRTTGISVDEADAMTKADLIERFGG
ncbi:hypothetical protein [Parafrankia sp. EUN1f]|uniref:hypothetical protein n=1 Tax=Parafrankia sp. EUN1f TaxID=102897 RepID=UPI0001C46CDF|nr:hypothetical protein [Parafrankia sp. EUN1f]EFC80242.1 hypothetical protein FrEUN1fDRAFT_6636 [Parafrankia sp. EUN1f]